MSQSRSPLVAAEPTLLLYRGEFLATAMRRQRVTHEEVSAAARSAGLGCMEDIEAVVLETDGTFSVVSRDAGLTPP